jgi:hypothetical protein
MKYRVHKKLSVIEYANKIDSVLSQVACFFGTSVDLIKSVSRTTPLPEARSIFVRFMLDNTDLAPKPILDVINRNRCMYWYINSRIDNEYDLKDTYHDFNEYMKNKNTDYYLAKVENTEIKAKLELIKSLIDERFKTKQFNGMMHVKLQDIIYLIRSQTPITAIINLRIWFDQYVKEFHDGNSDLMEVFENTGV